MYVSNAHVVLFSLATLWATSALAQCGTECDLDLFSVYFFYLTLWSLKAFYALITLP